MDGLLCEIGEVIVDMHVSGTLAVVGTIKLSAISNDLEEENKYGSYKYTDLNKEPNSKFVASIRRF